MASAARFMLRPALVAAAYLACDHTSYADALHDLAAVGVAHPGAEDLARALAEGTCLVRETLEDMDKRGVRLELMSIMALRRAADTASQAYVRSQAHVAEVALQTHVAARDAAWAEFRTATDALHEAIAPGPSQGGATWQQALEADQQRCERLQERVQQLNLLLNQEVANERSRIPILAVSLAEWKEKAEAVAAAVNEARSNLSSLASEVEKETIGLCRASPKPTPASLADDWPGDTAMLELDTALKSLCHPSSFAEHSLSELVAALPYAGLQKIVKAQVAAAHDATEQLEAILGSSRTHVATTTATLEAQGEKEALLKELKAAYETMLTARKDVSDRKYEVKMLDDDDSDGEGRQQLLSVAQHSCITALQRLDAVAGRVIATAGEHYPEVLREKKVAKWLQHSSGHLCLSARTLDDYTNPRPFAGAGTLLLAEYESTLCVLKPVVLSSDDVATIAREADILLSLDHPHVIKLEAVFMHGHTPHLHLPYYPAGNLAQLLDTHQSDGMVGVADLGCIAHNIVEALAFIAENGVVHCDVKPQNVLMSGDGTAALPWNAVLADFDVGHSVSGRTTTMSLQRGKGVVGAGTRGWVAPEALFAEAGKDGAVACASGQVRARARPCIDVFAFGALLYHMHYHPKQLPEAQAIDDEVAGHAGVWEAQGCGNAEWAAAMPASEVRSCTMAKACARPSARHLLQSTYFLKHNSAAAAVHATPTAPPGYWRHRHTHGTQRVDENEEVRAKVETLMNDTARPETHGKGADSHGIEFSRFVVTKVERVENAAAWAQYAARRHALAEATLGREYEAADTTPLLTYEFAYPPEGGVLEAAAGEVFLFHGTNYPDSVAATGLEVLYAFAGTGAGDMFGKGIYLADSASKADHYSRLSGNGQTVGAEGVMVLARVALGRSMVQVEARWNEALLPEVPGGNGAGGRAWYDSIVTDPEERARRGERRAVTFREVVLRRNEHVYPELIVWYRRE